MRGLQNLTWTVTTNSSAPLLTQLLASASQTGKTFLTVQRLVLEEFSEYFFKLQFQNFIGTIGLQEFKISSGTFSGIKLTSRNLGSLTFKRYFDYDILI